MRVPRARTTATALAPNAAAAIPSLETAASSRVWTRAKKSKEHEEEDFETGEAFENQKELLKVDEAAPEATKKKPSTPRRSRSKRLRGRRQQRRGQKSRQGRFLATPFEMLSDSLTPTNSFMFKLMDESDNIKSIREIMGERNTGRNSAAAQERMDDEAMDELLMEDIEKKNAKKSRQRVAIPAVEKEIAQEISAATIMDFPKTVVTKKEPETALMATATESAMKVQQEEERESTTVEATASKLTDLRKTTSASNDDETMMKKIRRKKPNMVIDTSLDTTREEDSTTRPESRAPPVSTTEAEVQVPFMFSSEIPEVTISEEPKRFGVLREKKIKKQQPYKWRPGKRTPLQKMRDNAPPSKPIKYTEESSVIICKDPKNCPPPVSGLPYPPPPAHLYPQPVPYKPATTPASSAGGKRFQPFIRKYGYRRRGQRNETATTTTTTTTESAAAMGNGEDMNSDTKGMMMFDFKSMKKGGEEAAGAKRNPVLRKKTMSKFSYRRRKPMYKSRLSTTPAPDAHTTTAAKLVDTKDLTSMSLQEMQDVMNMRAKLNKVVPPVTPAVVSESPVSTDATSPAAPPMSLLDKLKRGESLKSQEGFTAEIFDETEHSSEPSAPLVESNSAKQPPSLPTFPAFERRPDNSPPLLFEKTTTSRAPAPMPPSMFNTPSKTTQEEENEKEEQEEIANNSFGFNIMKSPTPETENEPPKIRRPPSSSMFDRIPSGMFDMKMKSEEEEKPVEQGDTDEDDEDDETLPFEEPMPFFPLANRLPAASISTTPPTTPAAKTKPTTPSIFFNEFIQTSFPAVPLELLAMTSPRPDMPVMDQLPIEVLQNLPVDIMNKEDLTLKEFDVMLKEAIMKVSAQNEMSSPSGPPTDDQPATPTTTTTTTTAPTTVTTRSTTDRVTSTTKRPTTTEEPYPPIYHDPRRRFKPQPKATAHIVPEPQPFHKAQKVFTVPPKMKKYTYRTTKRPGDQEIMKESSGMTGNDSGSDNMETDKSRVTFRPRPKLKKTLKKKTQKKTSKSKPRSNFDMLTQALGIPHFNDDSSLNGMMAGTDFGMKEGISAQIPSKPPPPAFSAADDDMEDETDEDDDEPKEDRAEEVNVFPNFERKRNMYNRQRKPVSQTTQPPREQYKLSYGYRPMKEEEMKKKTQEPVKKYSFKFFPTKSTEDIQEIANIRKGSGAAAAARKPTRKSFIPKLVTEMDRSPPPSPPRPSTTITTTTTSTSTSTTEEEARAVADADAEVFNKESVQRYPTHQEQAPSPLPQVGSSPQSPSSPPGSMFMVPMEFEDRTQQSKKEGGSQFSISDQGGNFMTFRMGPAKDGSSSFKSSNVLLDLSKTGADRKQRLKLNRQNLQQQELNRQNLQQQELKRQKSQQQEFNLQKLQQQDLNRQKSQQEELKHMREMEEIKQKLKKKQESSPPPPSTSSSPSSSASPAEVGGSSFGTLKDSGFDMEHVMKELQKQNEKTKSPSAFVAHTQNQDLKAPSSGGMTKQQEAVMNMGLNSQDFTFGEDLGSREEQDRPIRRPAIQQSYDNPYLNYYEKDQKMPSYSTPFTVRPKSYPHPFTVRIKSPETARPTTESAYTRGGYGHNNHNFNPYPKPFTVRPNHVHRRPYNRPYQSEGNYNRPKTQRKKQQQQQQRDHLSNGAGQIYLRPTTPKPKRRPLPTQQATYRPVTNTPFTVRPTTTHFTKRPLATLTPYNYVEHKTKIKPPPPPPVNHHGTSVYDPSLFNSHDVELKEEFDNPHFFTPFKAPPPPRPKLQNHNLFQEMPDIDYTQIDIPTNIGPSLKEVGEENLDYADYLSSFYDYDSPSEINDPQRGATPASTIGQRPLTFSSEAASDEIYPGQHDDRPSLRPVGGTGSGAGGYSMTKTNDLVEPFGAFPQFENLHGGSNQETQSPPKVKNSQGQKSGASFGDAQFQLPKDGKLPDRPIDTILRDLPDTEEDPEFPKDNSYGQDQKMYLKNPYGSDFIRLEVDVDRYTHNKSSSVGVHHIPLMINGAPHAMKMPLKSKGSTHQLQQQKQHKKKKQQQPLLRNLPRRKKKIHRQQKVSGSKPIMARPSFIPPVKIQMNPTMRSALLGKMKLLMSKHQQQQQQLGKDKKNMMAGGHRLKKQPPPPHGHQGPNSGEQLQLPINGFQSNHGFSPKKEGMSEEDFMGFPLGAMKDAMDHIPNAIGNIPGFMQKLMTSLDNPFTGRELNAAAAAAAAKKKRK